MLRQIERGVQNRPIRKNGVLPVTTLFSENFVSVQESSFDVPTIQISILELLMRVLLEGAFSL